MNRPNLAACVHQVGLVALALMALGCPGSSGTTTTTPVTVAPTITSFAASPASISTGQTTNLTWSVTGATSLSINPGVGTVTGTAKAVSPGTTTTYTLTATNSGGSATATATVSVTTAAPVISSFTASPATILTGTSVILAWTVTGATSLSVDQGVGTVTGLPGVSVKPTATTTYTLTATNAGGSVSQTGTVTLASVSITLDADRQPLQITHQNQPDALTMYNIPDMHTAVLQQPDQSYLLWISGNIGPNGGSVARLSTPDFIRYANAGPGTPTKAQAVFTPSCLNSDPSCVQNYDADYAGANSVIRASNGTDLLMFYEAGNQNNGGGWEYNVMALARSTDNGLTWTRQGVVLSGSDPKPTSKPSAVQPGIGEPGIVTANGFHYMIYFYHPNEPANPLLGDFLQIARAPVSSDGAPGAWMKYYNGTWTQPGLGGLGSTILPIDGSSGITGTTEAWPVFSTYLNAYVVVFLANQGWYFSTSTDLLTWAPPKPFAPQVPRPFQACLPSESNFVLVTPGNQPGVIGQTGYVLYAHTDREGLTCGTYYPHELWVRSFTFGKTP